MLSYQERRRVVKLLDLAGEEPRCMEPRITQVQWAMLLRLHGRGECFEPRQGDHRLLAKVWKVFSGDVERLQEQHETKVRELQMLQEQREETRDGTVLRFRRRASGGVDHPPRRRDRGPGSPGFTGEGAAVHRSPPGGQDHPKRTVEVGSW